jgi:hypothetical protein
MDPVLVFPSVFIALYVAHHVGDHWVQTGWQSLNKHYRTWTGRRACAAHVATLTLTKAALLCTCVFVLDLDLSWIWTSVALTADAVSHYWCDRRFTLKRLASFLDRDGYWDFCTVIRRPGGEPKDTGPGTGSFHLDQSWHFLWLFAASLLVSATA